MIEIPNRLQDENLNFVLVRSKDKNPIEKSWQTLSIKSYCPKLIRHLKNNGNYGILGGNGIITLDFDNKKVQEELLQKLPKTFTVKTGSGLLHKYFISDNCKSQKVLDKNQKTLIDIQGDGKFVVGPNSIHPNGNKYEVIDNSQIIFLQRSKIDELIEPYNYKKTSKQEVLPYPKRSHDDGVIENFKSKVKIKDVLNHYGVDTSQNPTECLFHSSKRGKCLGFKDDVAHCFHCDQAWNVFSLVMEKESCNFRESLVKISDIFGITISDFGAINRRGVLLKW